MTPNLHMNSGGVARDNDFSTHTNSQTTNHIYLHPGPNHGEFDNWMRRIGSLLHVASEYTAIKSVLDLLTATFEPQRLFVINHAALHEFGIEGYIEILVVVDENQFTSKQMMKNFLKMACFRQKEVFINFETSFNIEKGINEGHFHYCAFARKNFWCFLAAPTDFQLH